MLISDLHDLSEVLQWCDACRGHKDGHCDGCRRAFILTEQRLRSATYHYHPASIGGVSGTRAVQKELCVDCYREDFRKAYAGAEPPDLPDRGIDPRFHAAQRQEERKQRVAKLIASLEIDPADREFLQVVAERGLRFL